MFASDRYRAATRTPSGPNRRALIGLFSMLDGSLQASLSRGPGLFQGPPPHCRIIFGTSRRNGRQVHTGRVSLWWVTLQAPPSLTIRLSRLLLYKRLVQTSRYPPVWFGVKPQSKREMQCFFSLSPGLEWISCLVLCPVNCTTVAYALQIGTCAHILLLCST